MSLPSFVLAAGHRPGSGKTPRRAKRLDRVYVNARAQAELGWTPQYEFAAQLRRVAAGEEPSTPLAQAIGAKGYGARAEGN